jgi:hypothetical protein
MAANERDNSFRREQAASKPQWIEKEQAALADAYVSLKARVRIGAGLMSELSLRRVRLAGHRRVAVVKIWPI